MNNDCSIDNKIFHICRCEYKFFSSKANVRGIGFGYKVTKGFLTFKKCIVVFVIRKFKLNKVAFKDLIPKMYKGIETDVVESGLITTDYKNSCINSNSLKKRVRPVLGGYSIGVANERVGGSMGCLVTDNHDNYILSCNHVLADNNIVPIGTLIIQPSLTDGGKSPKDVVGFLSEYVPIRFSSDNYVDCAVAKVLNKNNVSPKIALTGGPKGVRSPSVGLNIKKVGKVTELTRGVIRTINTTYIVKIKGRDVVFKNQIMTTSILDYGDSGALLLSEDNYAIGLMIAGDTRLSMANTMSDVLKSLNMLLVTD